MIISGQDFSQKVLENIRAIVEAEPSISRRALSLRVCEWLDWRAPDGKFKEMSCRTALLQLHRKGFVSLPERSRSDFFVSRKEKQLAPLPPMEPVCCSLHQLGGVALEKIGSRYSKASRLWKALMSSYHYLGAGPLCGAQLRYLIRSASHGYLGALAFSAAAWRVAARDQWIGWSEQARRQHLPKVVCNSRFLILPQVQVANLASHVLSLCARRIEQDWHEHYGFAPVLLESFVQRDRFAGTCYRAANWQHVGSTCGRGRQDRHRNGSVPAKDVFVLPLRKNAVQLLCGESPAIVINTGKQGSEVAGDWAEQELGRADFGDHRLTRRLVAIAGDFYARPQANVAQACQGRAKTKAAYRFFDNPETTMDKILQSHYESSVQRAAQEKIVLAVQDTTTLDYSAHPATERLGPIAFKANGRIGLLVHDTMAFNLEGTPLGLLDVQCWARDFNDIGKKKRRKKLPIEQKESHKWLVSFNKVLEAQRRCPNTTLVSVADREADIYELFELALGQRDVPKLLVRAFQNRLLAEDQGHLWSMLAQQPAAGIQEVSVPRRGKYPARTACLQVRFAQATLKPPSGKARLPKLRIWAIHAKEVGLSEQGEPLEWMLLTTAETATFEQALEKLRWYALRWGIEVYHRTLKSGCKIEERQLGHADRIEACLAIDMVVAWRIFHLTKLGREVPDVPCSVFFEEAQWKALAVYINRNPIPPRQPPSLRQATRMVASLGGFLGRKGDGEPGTKSLWIGLQRLDDLTEMWKVMIELYGTNLRDPPVSSVPGYG
jgi:Druantia protein DruA/Transposase Tn5 dimerisation domain/Transposase DNA-binding